MAVVTAAGTAADAVGTGTAADVDRVGGVGQLGPEWDGVFGPGVQLGRDWFAATEAAALPAGCAAEYLAVRDAGQPLAVLPLRSGRPLASLTTPYTVDFRPLLAPGADPCRAGALLGRALRRHGVVLLEAMDPGWDGLAGFRAGLRAAGLRALPFDHFGNWHSDVTGLDWPGFLAGRPGEVRSTLRRKSAAARKDGTIRFERVTDPAAVGPALAAYEAIYARSWKEPEPFPHFNAALLPALARRGVLRMGLAWQGEVPLAAQYWTVCGGVATVLKLAHDEALKALSPGTLLTAFMIEGILAEGGITRLDFGRGDDPYKRQWVDRRTQRIGLLLAHPLRPAGLLALGRHVAGTLRRRGRTG